MTESFFPPVIYVTGLILATITALPVVYLLFFAVAGVFYRKKIYPENKNYRKIAVLIPAYKEDAVIVNVAEEALKQNYPQDFYDVFVIADSLMPETVSALKLMPLKVVEVVFNKRTKAKALNRALQKMNNIYDITVVLDADNLMEKNFLRKVNNAFSKKIIAIQGHRTASNTDTSLAVLDAISEEINNHIFRKGHRAVGLSSAIIGSGMAFQTDYFRQLISESRAVGGFDKEIELRVLRERYKIEYLEDAFVYDEKVSREDVFTNQRRRWLSAQVHYLGNDFFPALRHLILKGNVDYFDKIIQFMLPPRVLLLAAVILLSAFFIPASAASGLDDILFTWIALLLLTILVFVFSIPRTFYNRRTLKAVLSVPRGMWLMMLSLLKIRGANKNFLHTVHGPAIKTKT